MGKDGQAPVASNDQGEADSGRPAAAVRFQFRPQALAGRRQAWLGPVPARAIGRHPALSSLPWLLAGLLGLGLWAALPVPRILTLGQGQVQPSLGAAASVRFTLAPGWRPWVQVGQGALLRTGQGPRQAVVTALEASPAEGLAGAVPRTPALRLTLAVPPQAGGLPDGPLQAELLLQRAPLRTLPWAVLPWRSQDGAGMGVP